MLRGGDLGRDVWYPWKLLAKAQVVRCKHSDMLFNQSDIGTRIDEKLFTFSPNHVFEFQRFAEHLLVDPDCVNSNLRSTLLRTGDKLMVIIR